MAVVTGAGAVCATGTGTDALWQALSAGTDGLRPIVRFDVTDFATRIAGLWPAWDRTDAKDCQAIALATEAAREAVAGARLTADPRRIALILGTCFGQRYVGFSELTEAVADAVGAKGPRITVSTACSSSTTAIGLGRDLLAEGAVDAVIAGGADVITREVFAGFHAIGALAVGKCAPFGEPPGMTIGEGAGFVVLQRAADARVTPWTHVLGYGLSADAHHETSPDPSGSGVARAIRSALEDAGLTPDAIDFVSAHGTGTDSNDAAEWLAVRTALGTDRVPIASLKSFLGHAQGAAGVLELIGVLLCARRGLIPPTLRAAPKRPGAPFDPVADGTPRAHRVRHALKLSAAFGGANAALVVGDAAEPPVRARKPVTIAGLSAIGPHGLDLAALASARGPLIGAVPAFELSSMLRSAPARDLDPSGKYVSAAVALALADAKRVVRGADRERTGVFTGNSRMPAHSAYTCQASIDARGITHIAAGPFTHMVINAPAGTAAKLMSLKGPLLVVSAGRCSGLLAMIRAAEHLAARPGADTLVAGGLDELWVKPAPDEAEGAAFAVLSTQGAGVPLSGWGVAGPDDLPAAIAAATRGVAELDGVVAGTANPSLGALDPARLPLGLIDVHALIGGAEAAASAFALVIAAARVRGGAARRLLVVASGASISCAAVVGGGDQPRGQ